MTTREKKPAKNAIAALHASHWAITPDALQQMMEIAARALDEPISTIEALEAKIGKPVNADELMTVRDGVATIRVQGPLFRYANIFTMISGATSYQTLATDLQQAVDDSKIRGIVLLIDSPGGEVNGSAELANMIFDARGTKPIVAYVAGMGASAAYWIASAATEVVVAPTAILGSIGAVLSVSDRSAADAARGVKTIEIVSSQSPKKRLSPTSSEGQAALQDLVDTLASVFVDAVARNRDVSADTVLSDFGQGGVFVGEASLTPGLADRLGSYEAIHAELAGGKYSAPVRMEARTSTQSLEQQMPDLNASDTPPANPAPSAPPATPPATEPAAGAAESGSPAAPDAAPAAVPDATGADAQVAAATAERERIAAIEALGSPGQEQLIAQCVADPRCTPESAALRIVQSQRAGQTSRLRSLAGDDRHLEVPGPIAPNATDQNGAGAEARRIIAAHEKVTTSNRSK